MKVNEQSSIVKYHKTSATTAGLTISDYVAKHAGLKLGQRLLITAEAPGVISVVTAEGFAAPARTKPERKRKAAAVAQSRACRSGSRRTAAQKRADARKKGAGHWTSKLGPRQKRAYFRALAMKRFAK